jgi:hypothetical protein
MSDPKSFDPFDPISAAMGALHGQNLLAAKDARIRQLEERLEAMRDAGDNLAECLRFPKTVGEIEIIESIRDWQSARNNG